jgi:hypothetical protein
MKVNTNKENKEMNFILCQACSEQSEGIPPILAMTTGIIKTSYSGYS